MPITIISDTGVNTVYVNQNTGLNIIVSGISEQNYFNITGVAGALTPHNFLNGLQGGETGQFYHLTFDEYSFLVTGDVLRPSDSGGNATVGENLTVDTSTLFVDSVSNRVGVGTIIPAAPLHIDTAGAG